MFITMLRNAHNRISMFLELIEQITQTLIAVLGGSQDPSFASFLGKCQNFFKDLMVLELGHLATHCALWNPPVRLQKVQWKT